MNVAFVLGSVAPERREGINEAARFVATDAEENSV